MSVRDKFYFLAINCKNFIFIFLENLLNFHKMSKLNNFKPRPQSNSKEIETKCSLKSELQVNCYLKKTQSEKMKFNFLAENQKGKR